ncbi:hypothetical protein ASPZODRAFT_76111 [Penicilliopsis zonata CBS 506.65]|uniref:DUF6536 domain-containing protein n=1 Tax=Penicilliopsis zonata CBS 506.65 TaxID=1073090 RepID=A0A1L9S6I7_9EURO|nr:hypothetical protein ASPZODRAFT_76111 [Penicilliopsis zonata CBS 506.65]OJJ42781.1 hypothetical protein ASPZODRAFT_76111 [Penicilliopsis zonata CBS 506.65]
MDQPGNEEPKWFRGVYLCAKASTVIFLLNTTLIAVAAGLARRYPSEGDFASSLVFYEGSCEVSKRWDVILHWAINFLSTVILAASNYCMQTLVAPTREEVDAQHVKYQWLDIGSASIRNLFIVGRYQFTLWLVLLMTTTPFHLFLTTTGLEKCFHSPILSDYERIESDSYPSWHEMASLIAEKDHERITYSQCLQFSSYPVTGVQSIILLGDELTNSPPTVQAIPFLSHILTAESDSLICNNLTQWYQDDLSNSQEYTVSECLLLKTDEHCQLRYSPLICIVITFATSTKVIAMFLAARISSSRSRPLFTIGDAVASFLERPDRMTEGLCWASKTEICGGWKIALEAPSTYTQLSQPKRWMRGASIWRWLTTLTLGLKPMANKVQVVLPALRWRYIGYDYFDGIHSTAAMVIANLPQLLITITYFAYNNVLTSMLVAVEYSSYGNTRKPLRVTWPVENSQQQSTYWLTIPYRYGLLFLIIQMIIHWLVSQGCYYLFLTPYTIIDEPDPNNIYSGIFLSPLPIILAAIIMGFMLFILIMLSFRQLKSEIPLAGSCSAAISAACHPPKSENLETVALGLVTWGETTERPHWASDLNSSGRKAQWKGHCSFTSLETRRPWLTRSYA